MSFRAAVANTPQISNCYQQGLGALRAHSALINVRDTRGCDGSLDLDTCLGQARANENRWDYCFGYKNEAFFVEVHPAKTGDVDTMINKLNWLKEWLNNDAPEINGLCAKAMPAFHWLHTGYSQILPGSKYYFKAAQYKILPKARLEIKY